MSPIGRQIALTSLFAAVPVAVLVAFAMTTGLGAGVAALGGLAVVVATALLAHRVDRDLSALIGFLDRIEGDPTAPAAPPRPITGIGLALAGRLVRLHRALRSREQRLARRVDAAESILEALVDPVVILDSRRTIRRANAAALELLGDKAVGRDLAERMRHPDVLAAVDAVIAGQGPRTLDFTEPVPVERVFEIRIKPFPAGGEGQHGPDPGAGRPAAPPGESRRVLVTLHDITTIKRSEQMRADFVANASHELRTPLSTLIGFIETLRGPARDDGEARERFLSIMDEQAGRMSRLVNDLLSLSRIELDEHTPPTGRVDLAEVIHGVMDTLDMRARDRDMTLNLIAPDDPPRVPGDADQLAQVFQNLIQNAISYGRPESEVTIELRRVTGAPDGRGAGVAVAVRDRGEGIPKAHIPRLTERFYRVDPARSREIGGTGLGLAIVKHIVSRHRGRLAIESEPGLGSTFTVFLPAPKAAPRRGAGTTPAAGEPGRPVGTG
ncbi:MAG: ATP-binding protein [Azospirillaceae bacterium]